MLKLERARRIGKKYQNPVPTTIGGFRNILKVVPHILLGRAERSPKQPLGPFQTDPAAYREPSGSGLRVTWFGHSCLLVEQDGVTLLIDPVWDDFASPVQWAGPKRFFAPTIALEALPPIDAIVISHDHYDHLGQGTVEQLARLRPGVRWVTSLKVGPILQKFGVAAENITELDWTESTAIYSAAGAKLTLTALPARHFSGRSAFNRFQTLWSSFVLATEQHRVYHGVDSGLWEGYAAIGEQYGPFDLALLEIGAFHPLWHQIHLGPRGAVDAFGQLRAATLMPIHWGLFDLALHPWDEPISTLTTLAAERDLVLFQPEPGLPTDFVRGQDLRSSWWKQG